MNRQAGFSLVELIGVVALLGIVALIGAIYVDSLEAPLENSGGLLEGLLIQARARAISTTTAQRVRPANGSRLVVESADDCDAVSWTAAPNMDVRLATDVTLSPTAWAVCFTRRGVASENVLVTLSDNEGGSRQLEILRGGVVRWLD